MTRLDDIQARHAAATPGPWTSVIRTHEDEYYARFVEIGPPSNAEWSDGVDAKVLVFATEDNADAEFIAACPDDVGWLLDRVKELEAERETGSTPHKCLNDECETVAYGTAYDACPSCGDTSGHDAGQK